MRKHVTENYLFTITVIGGHSCRNGHQVGDTYTCEYGCPMPCGDENGFCAKTMLKLFSMLEAVRMGGDWRIIGQDKYTCEFYCPDGAIEFRVEATDKATIQPVGAERLAEYADVIRRGFTTVAQEFGWTKENCPGHTSFVTDERLASKIGDGYYPFGCCVDDKIFGFVSLTNMSEGAFEINDLSILPEWRHFGYGKKLLDYCKDKVKELGGNKIKIGIVEENKRLKDWYAANGFIHTGTQNIGHLPFTVGFMEWRAL